MAKQTVLILAATKRSVIFTLRAMKSYFGLYIKSPGGEGETCSVLVFDRKLSIGYRAADGSNTTLQWWMNEIEVHFDPALQSTRIRNRKEFGSELQIPGQEAETAFRQILDEYNKPWYRKSAASEWKRNSLLLVGIVGLLFLLYLLIVPWLSEKLATRVSVKTEQQMGEAVYSAMGMPALEDSSGSMLLNEFFAAMDVRSPYPVRITLIRENVVNAFALPGGRIVVYEGLLDQIRSYPELAALLSHEFTHVNNRHSTKSIFRRLGSKVFISLLFGRLGSVTAVLVDHADNLKSLKYSRKLEKEADLEGLSLLIQRRIDPAGFVDLFTHMKATAGGSLMPEFMASHPELDNRIAYIKESAKNASVEENPELKTIFDKLKN
jgi:Zn-dependent protease with chaperone function